MAANIRVFLRVRPSGRPSASFSQGDVDGHLAFERERESPDGQVDNSKTTFKFKFDGLLGMRVTQEDVFNAVAKPVIEDVLNGINGTIFAYGQTGSGKTFTITGSADKYEDRGLIPRTISYFFRAFQKGGASHKLSISYLEIYNDAGYDLLCGDDSTRKLEDLPKVQLREDELGNMHLRNLSVNMAQKEDDALNLLFLGDTNRVVAETPMNDASTRSHCMFILWVESTRHDSDTVKRAKLHLVDLAGSERISKTGITGNLQKEARYINLSLHHLEQVIVALHERSQGHRTHVPYRNSTMTSVLRDSLGGNCRTVMVGAIAVEDSCIDETISTCRFAQRVGAIKNNAVINEELDPQMLIRRLKKEAAELKEELKLLGSDGTEELGQKDIDECRQLVTAYLEEPDPEKPFVCGSVARFQTCFDVMREAYWRRLEEGGGSVPKAHSDGSFAVGSLEETVFELQRQVVQRDEELGLLVNSLGSLGKRARAQHADPVFIRGGGGAAPSSAQFGGQRSQQAGVGGAASPAVEAPDASALLLDRNKAFEEFRKSVRRSEAVGENNQNAAKLMAEAKASGERANAARAGISSKQQQVERLRMGRAMESGPQNQLGGEQPLALSDGPEAAGLLNDIRELKGVYQTNMRQLKEAKEELDGYHKAAEQSKARLQQNFEAWYASLQRSNGEVVSEPTMGEAWRVPVAADTPQAARAHAKAHALESGRLGSSRCSQASSADSQAHPTTPGLARASAASSAPRPAAVVHDLRGRSAAAPSPASAAPAPAAPAPAASAHVAPQALAADVPPATALTGDAQTDDIIAGYFASLAELQR